MFFFKFSFEVFRDSPNYFWKNYLICFKDKEFSLQNFSYKPMENKIMQKYFYSWSKYEILILFISADYYK